MSTEGEGKRWYGRALEQTDEEIARYSTILGIRLLDPGIVERVVRGDDSVCARKNADAFRKLRGLIGMHYNLVETNLGVAGADESAKMLAELRHRFRERHDLGGEPTAGGKDPAA
jgi:hypothetical protein